MHLYKHIRIHQIFGANTDVGKSLLSTALVLGSAKRGKYVRYLKPVSTGPLQDADDEFVKRFTEPYQERIKSDCLFRYKEPVSPHLAFRLENGRDSIKESHLSDDKVNKAISSYITGLKPSPTDLFIETAGGVHSPTLSGTSQIDGYRPLRLPIILVGDSHLGGISSTVSAYESLLIRGYEVDSVLVFREDYYRNWEYLTDYFKERDIRVFSFPRPPPKLDNYEKNFNATNNYYSSLISDGSLDLADQHLEQKHMKRIDELQSMPSRAMESLWWPFVQHGLINSPKDVAVFDSAHGDFFNAYRGHSTNSHDKDSLLSPLFDGSASWWTQTFGHGNISLALAAARAAGRYGHVMYPQAVHAPALQLAERLLSPNGPGSGWASRVFYSDDGSTAMEVALKIAIRAYCKRYGKELKKHEKQQLGILGLKGSYHGDTLGAMDACYSGDGVYTCEWHQEKGYWFDPPVVGMREGKAFVTLPPAIAKLGSFETPTLEVDSLSWLYKIENRLDTNLADVYRRFIKETLQNLTANNVRLAALVLEPLIMGAGGMIFVDPLFQRVLVDVVRSMDENSGSDKSWSGIPIIFDEVFVGLYRLGVQSCKSILGVNPDIAVYAKTLTGGTVPLSVTLASSSIFDAFFSDKKADALLHGHSYTAHAIGCEVANETMGMMDRLVDSESWTRMKNNWKPTPELRCTENSIWSFWSPSFITTLSKSPVIDSVMTLGTVLAFKFKGSSDGYTSSLAHHHLQSINTTEKEAFQIHYRTLGDVAYFMLSLNTTEETTRNMEERILSCLKI